MQLAGRTVLITGGRRLGAHLAELLAARGANIALSCHTSWDRTVAVAAKCRTLGAQADVFTADLREPDQAEGLIRNVVERFGAVDVLVNLTSIYTRTPFRDLRPEQYFDMLGSNLTAPYLTAVAAAQQMLRQPVVDSLQGKILHFTDWAVQRPYRDFLPYMVAKGALETLTRTLAVELAPTINVNAIAPGTVLPPPELSEERLETIRQSAALQRIGSPEDVNRLVLYLLEGTDFVTGEIFRVDGGRFLGNPERQLGDLDE